MSSSRSMSGRTQVLPPPFKPNIDKSGLKRMRRTIEPVRGGAGGLAAPKTEWPGGCDAVRPFWIRSQYVRACLALQVEYLNSGIAFNSSLVALKTAWSGYHGLGFDVVAGAVLVFAAPVVVDDAGRLPPAGGVALAPV